jgi:hypothetical protein
MHSRLLICSALLSLAASLVAAQIQIQVPPQGEAGSNRNSIPFFYGPDVSLRYQQVYGAGSFASLIPDGGWLTALAYDFVDTFAVFVVISKIQINLSTTSRGVDALGPVFAQNVGADDTQVFGSRSILLPSAVDWEFTARFTFDTPFYYDPRLGNLLVDLRVYQSGLVLFPPTGTPDMSSTVRAGDSVSRVYAFDVNATTGIASTIGLNTLFLVTPVPEPGSMAVLGLGVTVLVLWVSGQKRHASRQKGRAWR